MVWLLRKRRLRLFLYCEFFLSLLGYRRTPILHTTSSHVLHRMSYSATVLLTLLRNPWFHNHQIYIYNILTWNLGNSYYFLKLLNATCKHWFKCGGRGIKTFSKVGEEPSCLPPPPASATSSLLYSININQLNRLQRLQNISARLIYLTSKHSHITPVLANLHWLPISYRIKYKIGLFVYKIIHNNAPHYLSDLIHPYSSARTGLRSSGLMRLHEPRTSTLWGDRSFTAAAARVWNQLPLAIKLSSSITTFKKNLKSHLYKQAYSHNPQS